MIPELILPKFSGGSQWFDPGFVVDIVNKFEEIGVSFVDVSCNRTSPNYDSHSYTEYVFAGYVPFCAYLVTLRALPINRLGYTRFRLTISGQYRKTHKDGKCFVVEKFFINTNNLAFSEAKKFVSKHFADIWSSLALVFTKKVEVNYLPSPEKGQDCKIVNRAVFDKFPNGLFIGNFEESTI
jgi:hypothetical protein